MSTFRSAAIATDIAAQMAAIIFTLTLAGLWHGAGWHYVVWGALQGVGLAVAASWHKRLPPIPSIVGWAIGVGYFVGTLVVFRSGSFEAAGRIYEGLLYAPRLYGPQTLSNL